MDDHAASSDACAAARFSTLGLFVFVALVAAVLALAVALNSLDIVAAAGVIFIAWMARRFDVAHMAPLCVWCAGAWILIATLALLRANGDFFAAMAVLPLIALGAIVLVIAAIMFLICAAQEVNRRKANGNGVAALGCFLTGVLWFTPDMTSIGDARQAEAARRAAEDPIALQQLIGDVDRIVQKLGRTPENQSELESLLGRPLPSVYDGGTESTVHYQRTSDQKYMLIYELWATDDWIYNSAAPQAGWVQHFY